MKLEVGMHVRTERGTILKYNAHDILYNKFEDNYYFTYDTELCDSLVELVIKASHNIMDLIEVGDYVNGFYVEDVKETFVNVATGSDYFQSPTIYEEDIKSIVTKEQFKDSEYVVE